MRRRRDIDDLETIYGSDLPESRLAAAMKRCTIVRQRKLYPNIEIIKDVGQAVTDDMLAWVVRLEDYAIVQAVYEALRDGRLHSGIILAEEDLQKLLDRQEPRLVCGICPNCGHDLVPGINTNYCGNCGQAVKWTYEREDIQVMR